MSRRSLNNYHRSHPISELFERYLHNKMCFVIGNSEAVISELKNEGSRSKKNKKNLQRSEISEPFSKTDLKKISLKLGVKDSYPIIVIIANIRFYKGMQICYYR